MPDAQTVTAVTHWTDRLFSFRVTRPASLRFDYSSGAGGRRSDLLRDDRFGIEVIEVTRVQEVPKHLFG